LRVRKHGYLGREQRKVSPDRRFGTAKAIAVRRCDHYAGRFRAQQKADRRNRIAAAAVHLHAARDYADVAIADVCACAKVSKRYVHVHFADREDLLQAVSLQAVSLQAIALQAIALQAVALQVPWLQAVALQALLLQINAVSLQVSAAGRWTPS
jgi:AcrR family transcriptional regulator